MIDYTLPLEQLPDPLPIEPLRKPFDVTITPPGSKSITCRAYVLAALAAGESRIIRPLRAEDTDLLLKALCTLGAEARWDGDDVLIKGVAGRFPRGGSVNLGDGGTPTRFMIACACLAAEPVVVDGSPRMRERPIAEGVDMLRQLGAKIEYVEAEGRLPVRVVPSDGLKGGQLAIGQTQSSQFISAVMLIAPHLDNGVNLSFNAITSVSYVILTKRVMELFGVPVKLNLLAWFNRGKLRRLRLAPRPILARSVSIECDASSAVYWALSAMLVPGSRVRIERLTVYSPQPDMEALYALEQLGGSVDVFDADDYGSGVDYAMINSPKYPSAIGIQSDCETMPDGSIALAVAGACCRSSSRLSGLRTLRVKETDRIAALANELRRVGCTVETGEDWIEITPAPEKRASPPAEPGANGVIIETYNDHRMAMAFAVLGLVRPGISIRNPACVRKSYPTFWKDFAKLYQ